MSVPSEIDNAMFDILTRVWERLSPAPADPLHSPVKRHVWFDENYVGMVDGSIVRWEGWYANFRELGYGVLYIDYVPNILDYKTQKRLYGESYVNHVYGKGDYISAYLTSCTRKAIEGLESESFVVRVFERAVHPCIIVPEKDFFESLSWIETRICHLVEVQRRLCLS